jgi:hypothetical protein
MFDRSWYNRAGVEHVMGFCPPEEYARFLADAPGFERHLAAEGITVVKLWFSITRAEQLARFVRRHDDPVKRWKLSPIDLASLDKWHEYTRAKEAMFRHTDIPEAPWTIIKSNDKKRARLEAMRHVLSLFDYPGKDEQVVGRVDALIAGPAALLPELADGPFEPALAGRAPAGRTPAGRTAIERAAIGRPDIGRPDIGRTPNGRTPGARSPGGRTAIGRPDIGRPDIGRAAIGRAAPGEATTRRAAAKRTAAERTGGARTGDARTGDARTDGPRAGGARTAGERTGGARTGGAQSGGARTNAERTGGPRTRGPRAGGPRTA